MLEVPLDGSVRAQSRLHVDSDVPETSLVSVSGSPQRSCRSFAGRRRGWQELTASAVVTDPAGRRNTATGSLNARVR